MRCALIISKIVVVIAAFVSGVNSISVQSVYTDEGSDIDSACVVGV